MIIIIVATMVSSMVLTGSFFFGLPLAYLDADIEKNLECVNYGVDRCANMYACGLSKTGELWLSLDMNRYVRLYKRLRDIRSNTQKENILYEK